MRRDLMIPAILALAVHGLLALIPVDFMVRASPPSHGPIPLQILFVRREPIHPTPAPKPLRKVSPHIQQHKFIKAHKKVVHQRPSPKRKMILPEKTSINAPVQKKVARNQSSTSKKTVKPEHKEIQAGEQLKKQPKQVHDVSSKSKLSKPKVNPPVRTKRELPLTEPSPQFSEDRPVSHKHGQEMDRNSLDSDKLRQTSAFQPYREEKSSAPVRTMAIPKYKLNRPPSYPRVARLRGQEGKCVMRVNVLPDGRVGAIDLARSSGYDVLDKAALRTVKSWRFTPGTQDGKPVAMWVQVPITFRLK